VRRGRRGPTIAWPDPPGRNRNRLQEPRQRWRRHAAVAVVLSSPTHQLRATRRYTSSSRRRSWPVVDPSVVRESSACYLLERLGSSLLSREYETDLVLLRALLAYFGHARRLPQCSHPGSDRRFPQRCPNPPLRTAGNESLSAWAINGHVRRIKLLVPVNNFFPGERRIRPLITHRVKYGNLHTTKRNNDLSYFFATNQHW